ncbi:MAG: fumarate hydratase [Candidatus Omnitrophica bacterium CG11_big_fil_rev_8_21_14_0_20_42_13]|uniref:Fumarate hydratase n=1 Tax=Candidatus Ghiorseimicrobium undicola TaxID=1974746 RepID=A0A2H0LW29_9BACT|nr:MAG: fumarate hydratase [Candidatus Omnitrophica bacterium CG11_big_fil_rev_8_21_14_0_20_42_13]
MVKNISAKLITQTVADLSIKANTVLRGDILRALEDACKKEDDKRAKKIFKELLENARIANDKQIAICQDTGMPLVFVELGQEARIGGGGLKDAINKGIALGYKKGRLRASVVSDPLGRSTPGYSPAIIHIDITGGNKLKLTVSPKGFGCENKSQLKMFNPTGGIDEIIKFIVEAVASAGPDACPPYVLGIGIGGTADFACFLAKKALLRNISIHNTQYAIRKLEHDLLYRINNLNIGPMGLGGRTTALGVSIEAYPTHIAGLPVCVNISCHALRMASALLI